MWWASSLFKKNNVVVKPSAIPVAKPMKSFANLQGRERINARMREWRANNKERCKEYERRKEMKEGYAEHKAAYGREYLKMHRAEIYANIRRYEERKRLDKLAQPVLV